jgi:AcrR family transcriptional regulator
VFANAQQTENTGKMLTEAAQVTHSRRERERQERRRQILAAALKIFARDGYENANVDNIANQAELSKGALYLYFPSKRHLFLTLLEESNQELNSLLLKNVQEAGDPLEKVRALFESFLGYFDRNLELMRIMFLEYRRLVGSGDEILQTILKHHRWRNEYMADIIRQGIQAGQLRPLPVDLVVSILTGMTSKLVVDKLEGDLQEELRTYIPLVEEIFLRGTLRDEKERQP